ncbi:hypothetical protein SKAU_G00182170 [Synaphobranchus kaupii]|uniref:Doublecortin domain-containing protein n=1 Tax=Synaphobranchus kaupii TaxID=118154 RepID=A0A9Q1FCA5_SYNKA|nr:hypothetical protein SKAU_G00182170 [Synaphobranchus kaupii]
MVRRNIVLHLRTVHSLRLFLEEISELLHCHVRKLYTLEGHKVPTGPLCTRPLWPNGLLAQPNLYWQRKHALMEQQPIHWGLLGDSTPQPTPGSAV